MRLCTWNINSIRQRLDLLGRLTEENRPDVICLQETKVTDDLFPHDACAALGYSHRAIRGMKGYNGVAILSRLPLSDIHTPDWCGREDCRHLIAVVEGVEVHCLYIPAGGDIPDPEQNDKFAHKLQFVDELTDWYAKAFKPEQKILLCGDFNIAPLPTDVWGHKQLLKVVSHTPIEVEKLTKMQQSLPFIDAVRAQIPPDEKLFTWWSYRSPDWKKNDRGRRLDHIWVSPALKDSVRAASVLRPVRDWPQPSDHVPVLLDLDL